jgi:hypothetical protein
MYHCAANNSKGSQGKKNPFEDVRVLTNKLNQFQVLPILANLRRIPTRSTISWLAGTHLLCSLQPKFIQHVSIHPYPGSEGESLQFHSAFLSLGEPASSTCCAATLTCAAHMLLRILRCCCSNPRSLLKS